MLYSSDPAERFRYVEPPFQFNAADIARYPVEVTGYHLLQSLRRRLGWPELAGKRLLDFGCGVRFARTIVNLDLEIGAYAGVDVNAGSIGWLSEQIADPRFTFTRIDMRQEQYNPSGEVVRDPAYLRRLGLTGFDAACMFSVITHQGPDDTRAILAMLRETVIPGGQLYFTAFTDETVDGFRDGDPERPTHYAIFNPDALAETAVSAGWAIEHVYPKSDLQQTAFVGRAAERH